MVSLKHKTKTLMVFLYAHKTSIWKLELYSESGNKRSRPIIKKFTRCNIGREVFVNKKKVKNIVISITRSLTKRRMRFLKRAKVEFNNVWTVHGQILYYDEVAKKVQVSFQ